MSSPSPSPSPSPSSSRPPGRPRDHATRRAVLEATYELLGGEGLRPLTIEAVSGRSGVARTTIYRWWSSKGALAMESFLEAVAPSIDVIPTASALEDVKSQLRRFVQLLQDKPGRIIRGIMAEGQSDPETIDAFLSGFVMPRRRETRAIMQRGMDSGELRPDLDIEIVLSGLYGPIYLRLMLNEGLDDEWVERLLNTMMGDWRCPGG